MTELVILGLALLLVPVLYRHAGVERAGHLDLIGIGGVLLLLSAATRIPIFETHVLLVQFGHFLGILAQGLGVLFFLIGTLWGMLEVLGRTPHTA